MTGRLRRLALEVILEPSGAFVEDRLARALSRSGCADPRDRALVSELVLGTVKRRATLDSVVAAFSDRPVGKIDAVVLEGLRLGVYQILFTHRIPPHAAVDETVAAIALAGRKHAASFANAVLRAILRARRLVQADQAPPDRRLTSGERWIAFDRAVLPAADRDLAAHLAASASHPAWLVRRWLDRFGETGARAILDAGNASPPVAIVPARLEMGELARRFAAAGIAAKPSPDSAALLVTDGGAVAGWPGFAEGAFLVQDTTQARAVRALLPPVPARILDLCAAPGTKSAHLALLAPGARIFAVDSRPVRAARILDHVRRYSLARLSVVVADVRRLPFSDLCRFPAVFLDVPCSNTGVLARRVEARWRASAQSLSILAGRQREFLEAAAARVDVGGVLVYATCSLEPEENEDVVRPFAREHGEFVVETEERTLPSSLAGGGYWARLRRSPSPVD